MTAAEELFEEVMRLLIEEPDNWASEFCSGTGNWWETAWFWKHVSGVMITDGALDKIWETPHYLTAEGSKGVRMTKKQSKCLIPALVDLRAEKILRIVRRYEP